MTYRPPGRSHRAGRAQADNDVFEGLPVKQWGQSITHVSLAPPRSEVTATSENDRWDMEPPMPRDFQLLQPWTQQLLRLARSGKFGNKRKSDSDGMDDEKPEDEAGGEDGTAATKPHLEDRGYMAKKWKPVPEAMLEPEHKHFEFLAKRRKGLASLYAPELHNGLTVPMRKTKVQKTGPDGEITIYEALVPEGQTIEGEVTSTTELADVKVVTAAPGTVIEGVGIANDEGVVVAEHLKPAAPRRNRPPPKKKGGPGRGKKRVTFTNPDGSTYTTIVPNATKIVPAPGQIVTHVAKGEEAKADITAEQAAANAAAQQQTEGEDGEGDDGEGEGSDDEGEGDEGDEDEDREEGEVSEDAQSAGNTPRPPSRTATAPPTGSNLKIEDTLMEDAPATDNSTADPSAPATTEAEPIDPSASTEDKVKAKGRSASSSPDLPLAKTSHSRTNSLVSPTTTAPVPAVIPEDPAVAAVPEEAVVEDESHAISDEMVIETEAEAVTVPAAIEEDTAAIVSKVAPQETAKSEAGTAEAEGPVVKNADLPSTDPSAIVENSAVDVEPRKETETEAEKAEKKEVVDAAV